MELAEYLLYASGSSAPKGLDGPLRVMPGGYLGDDTGYRRILIDHDFPLIRLWLDDNAEARRGVIATKNAGFQGSRVAHLMACDRNSPPTHNPNDYWYKRDIDKEMFRAAGREALTFMAQNGLRFILTAGHEYVDANDEYSWWEEVTGSIKDWGLQQALLWPECLGNEVGVNRPWLADDTPAAMQYVKPIQDIVRRNLPGTLMSNGDFGQEDDLPDFDSSTAPSLCGSSVGAELTDIHPRRHMPEGCRYPHTIWYATHYFGSCRKPTSEGEEPGENTPYEENRPGVPRNMGGDVYIGCDNPYYLHTRISIDQLTGQATSYLNGPGVRRFVPLDSTKYFNKIVKAVSVLPEDIPTWQDDHNPSWFNKGKDFVYVGLAQWGQIPHPPRPVASWEVYDINGLVATGEGPIQPPSNWLGGIVKGTYA